MEIYTQAYLRSLLTVPVNVQYHPNQKYQVVLQKTGTSSENHIKTATLAVQSFAPTYKEAYDLNDTVLSQLKEMQNLGKIANVNISNVYPYPYPVDDVYRYQAVVIITHY